MGPDHAVRVRAAAPPAVEAALHRFVAALPGAPTPDPRVRPRELMADLRDWFVEAVEDGDEAFFTAFLAEVERLAASDDDAVRDLVATLGDDLASGADPRLGRAIAAVGPLLGRATAAALGAGR